MICKDCDITFKHPGLKRRHFESVHYQKKYECPDCHKLFSRPDNLKRHEYIHSDSTGHTNVTDTHFDIEEGNDSLEEEEEESSSDIYSSENSENFSV